MRFFIRLRWLLIILTIVIMPIVNGEVAVNDKSSSRIVTSLSISDGEAIKTVLIERLLSSEDPDIKRLSQELTDVQPWIDAAGTLYIGTWRYDTHKARLIKRPVGVSQGAKFEADVTRESGHWSIGPVTVGRLLPR